MTLCDPYPNPGEALCNEVLLSEALASRDAKRYPDPAPRTDVWTLRFYARGTNDECILRQRLEDPNVGIPGRFQGQPLEYYDVRNIGWQLWECTATYNWYGASQVGASSEFFYSLPSAMTLSTSGGRIQLTQSLDTISRYPIATGQSPPDFNGAINWDGTRVQGVQVGAASPRYTETWIVNREFLFESVTVNVGGEDWVSDPGTSTYTYGSRIDLFTDYTWTVHGPNPSWSGAETPPGQGDPFRNWAIGNVALSGVNVRQIAMEHFEVTLEYQIQPTKKFTVPASVDPDTPEFTGAGWNYVWFYYMQEEAKANQGETEEYTLNAALPKFMYEEQIYRRKNFTDLGFGINPFLPAFTNLMCMASPDLEGDWDSICNRPPDP